MLDIVLLVIELVFPHHFIAQGRESSVGTQKSIGLDAVPETLHVGHIGYRFIEGKLFGLALEIQAQSRLAGGFIEEQAIELVPGNRVNGLVFFAIGKKHFLPPSFRMHHPAVHGQSLRAKGLPQAGFFQSPPPPVTQGQIDGAQAGIAVKAQVGSFFVNFYPKALPRQQNSQQGTHQPGSEHGHFLIALYGIFLHCSCPFRKLPEVGTTQKTLLSPK